MTITAAICASSASSPRPKPSSTVRWRSTAITRSRMKAWAKLYRDTGREAEAIAAFQEALRLDPRLVTAKRELEKLTAAQAASAVVPVK